MKIDHYPVVDLFAGPGGLGEGFLTCKKNNGARFFSKAVSIEREKFSHQTLLLRHFLHAFGDSEYPSEYYDYLRGDICKQQMFSRWQSEFVAASESALSVVKEMGFTGGVIKRDFGSSFG
jgi:DNA (cytosine-5)-methyltransferase 1